MTDSAKLGTVSIAAGTLAGAGVSNLVGNVGVSISGTAIAVGAPGWIGVGTIAGAATYGAYRGLADRDPLALGAFGVGAIGGVGIYSTIGGIGIVGGFGGLSLGVGSLAATGGMVGLGIYGALKLLDQGSSEPAAAAFSRMEERINADFLWQMAYTDALLEVFFHETHLLYQFKELEAEDELQKLKAELRRRHLRRERSRSSQSCLTKDLEQGVWIEVDTLDHHSATVNAIAVHADHATVLTASDDQSICSWDIHSGRQLHTFPLAKPVLAIALHSQTQTFASAGLDNTVTIWSLDRKVMLRSCGTTLESKHTGAVTALAYSPDGKTIASGSFDQSIRIWHNDGILKRTLNEHTEAVFSIAIALDGKTLVSGSADRSMRIWDLTSFKPAQVLTGHVGWVNVVSISPDGRTIVSGSADATIKLWSLQTGELDCTLEGHSGSVTSLAISPDGKTIVSSSLDGTIRLWKLRLDSNGKAQGSALQILPGKGVVGFSADGKMLIVSGEKGILKLWQLQ